MVLVVLSVILLVCWLLYKLKRRHAEKCAAAIPGETWARTIQYSWKLIRAKDLRYIVEELRNVIFHNYENGILKGWFGPVLVVGLWDPHYIQEVADSPNAANKGNVYLLLLGDIFRGMFVVPGDDEWKNLKKPFMKLMAKKYILNDYHKIFIEKNKKFVNFIKESRCGKEVDIVDDFRHLEVEIIANTHFGLDIDELRSPKYFWLENLERYLEVAGSVQIKSVIINIINSLKEFIGPPKTVEKILDQMLGFNKWVYEEKEKVVNWDKPEDDKEYYPEFLVRNARKNKIPKSIAYRQMSDLISGGGDTTSTTLASVVVFLGMFPDMQEKAFQEQKLIFGEDVHRDPTVEDLASMEYLDRFLKETLRIVAPPAFFKQTTGDVKVGKYTIPGGTILAFLSEFVHNNPKYYERPKEFYPDHFLPEKEASRPTHAFIPYGCGVRLCPGTAYASNSLKMTLSYVLRNFRITTDLKFEDCTYDYHFMRVLRSGYKVQIHERYS